MYRLTEVKQGRSYLTTPFRIILVQLVVTIAGGALVAIYDRVAALSVLLGGVTAAVPAGYSALRLSRRTANPARSLSDMVMAEFGKYALTGLLLVVIFVTIEPLAPLYFFGTLFGLHGAYIVVPLLSGKKRSASTVSDSIGHGQK